MFPLPLGYIASPFTKQPAVLAPTLVAGGNCCNGVSFGSSFFEQLNKVST
ncbi:hypothetical protein V2687_03700 [Tenacibaculum maritimum]